VRKDRTGNSHFMGAKRRPILDIFLKIRVGAILRGFLRLFPTCVLGCNMHFGHFYLSAQINRPQTVYGNNCEHKLLQKVTKII
jgi:hypothetical protein